MRSASTAAFSTARRTPRFVRLVAGATRADITSTVAFTCRARNRGERLRPEGGEESVSSGPIRRGSCRCPLGRIAIGPLLCPLGEGDLSEPRIAPVASRQIRLDATQKVRGVRFRAERRRCGYLPSRPVRVTALPATRRQLADPPELTTSGHLKPPRRHLTIPPCSLRGDAQCHRFHRRLWKCSTSGGPNIEADPHANQDTSPTYDEVSAAISDDPILGR